MNPRWVRRVNPLLPEILESERFQPIRSCNGRFLQAK
jgi:hypothetical protein